MPADIAKQSAKALAQVIAYYKKTACPCAFPRFAQLTGFDFRHYGTGPVGCHLTDMLISLAVTTDDATFKPAGEWMGNERRFVCAVCGTEGTLYSEQYNINLTVMSFTLENIKAKRLGAPAEDRIPIPNGFYGFQPADIANCRPFFKDSSVQEMTDYLMALA
jgi:hypothetical protein